MGDAVYDAKSTALLLVDPYNDFMSEGGKVWPLIREVAEEVGLLDNLRTIARAVRDAGIQVVIVPHRRWQAGDYASWGHPNPNQRKVMAGHHFARGEWGGEWHPDFAPQPGDIVAQEHWCSSGFANTDLDLLLKKHGIHELIVIGLIAHSCVEATVRYGAELGYQVTVVRDATTSYSDDHMHAALDINLPNYAAVVSTVEVVDAIRPSR